MKHNAPKMEAIFTCHEAKCTFEIPKHAPGAGSLKKKAHFLYFSAEPYK
jgi:hypothetical protein